MAVELSCAFATELATPDHIAVAESLGYRRAWCYDSPALYPDVWMILGHAAQRTSTIALGPGVLIPSLRHPMVTAAAIATLVAQAPGRVEVGIGSGFTGRISMGRRPMRWDDVRRYVGAVRALLRGATLEWDGAPIAMLHPGASAPPRPIDVPIVIGADGPRGLAVAHELGDGVFSANPRFLGGIDVDRRTLLMWGTVLGDGEDPASPRVIDTLGPATAVLYHATYDRGGPDAVDALPNGRAWRARIESAPADRRHLAVHAGHQLELNDADRMLFPDAASAIPKAALVGDAAQMRHQLAAWEASGITEVAFQPAGPDIAGELERFAAAAHDLPS
jgi:5,10-methylenetetrahydromethanopterin reductase